MNWRSWAVALAVAWAVLGAHQVQADVLPPEAHGRLPFADMPQMSPDGQSVAYIRQFGGTKELVVVRPGQPRYSNFYYAMPQIYPVPEIGPIKPTGLTWLSDRDLALSFTLTVPVLKGVNKLKKPFDLEGLIIVRGVDVPYTSSHDQVDGFLVSAGRVDGGPVLLGRFEKRGLYLGEVNLTDLKDLRRLDVLGRSKEAGYRDDEAVIWMAGPEGAPLLRVRIAPPPNPRFRLERRDASQPDAPWITIRDRQEEDSGFAPLGFAKDPAALLGLVDGAEGRRVVAPLDLASGAIGPPVFAAPAVDVDGAVSDPYSSRILGFEYVGESETIFWIDAGMKGLQESTERAFPGERVQIVSWSRARDRLLIRTEGPRDSGAFWSFNPATGERILVEKLYPAIPDDQVAAVRPFSYRARDGLALSGYMTLPPGRAEKKLPTIIMPHGGPAARDELGFDWWAQALAARGYLVVQPNFRGSAGFGRSFEDAGQKQWGQAMQSDLSDALAFVVDQGLAEPDRVCIVGASYGGYAALAGATLTPDLYRCAVSVAGVSDLPLMINSTRDPKTKDGFAVRYWSRIIGDPVADADMLRAVSPRFQAAKVKAPILLIHGRDDTVVPISQSLFMRDALQAAGKSVVLVELVGEDHFLRREQTRTQMLAALYKFLSENNPADP